MAAKYFVWGEGVWREIDLESGRVTGWRRRARFVYVRSGRLLVARRRPVLRALEALAVGQPSAAADGPRLAYRSKSESRTKRKHETPAVPTVSHVPPLLPVTTACAHHHCCVHTVHRSRQQGLACGDEPEIMCATNNTRRNSRCTDVDKRPAAKRNTATQCAPGASPLTVKQAVMQEHRSTAPTPAPGSPDYSSAEEFVSKSVRGPSLAAHTKTVVNEVFGKTSATKPPAAADDNNTTVSTHAAVKSGDQRRERARKRARTVVNVKSEMSADESVSSGGQSPFTFKELIVSDADVALLRGFVARTCPWALQRFDADEDYKCMLLRAINPLVHVEPCARLARLLAPARPRPPRRLSADTDKENKDSHSSLNKVRELVSAMKKSSKKISTASPPTRLGVSERDNKLDKETAVIKASKINNVASDPPRAKPEPRKKKAAVAPEAGDCTAAGSIAEPAPPDTHVISKRASQPAAKEYSNLEDHAIVAWLSSGSRACLVSGNRVWRDLQEEYKRLTGRERSWHSLRNRYLRYILPSLGALHLPPADVSRLRAAAATGAIKTKSRLAARRRSALTTPARGASWRRPRPPGGASSDDTASAAVHDATGPPSPKRRSPRSRPPQSASKDTSNKDDSADECVGAARGGGARSPRYSEVTRLFALRRRRSSRSASPPPPRQARSPEPAPPATRSRHLFNPNAHA